MHIFRLALPVGKLVLADSLKVFANVQQSFVVFEWAQTKLQSGEQGWSNGDMLGLDEGIAHPVLIMAKSCCIQRDIGPSPDVQLAGRSKACRAGGMLMILVDLI